MLFVDQNPFFSSLKQITYYVYNSGWHQNLETIVISEGEAPGCDAKRDNVLTVNVPLPLLPPTDWTTSQIVKVRYYCRVRELFAEIMWCFHCLISNNFHLLYAGNRTRRPVPSQSRTSIADHDWYFPYTRCTRSATTELYTNGADASFCPCC